MKKCDVGIIGATGMVGQRFITLLENHPWFNIKVLAASSRSAGKKYSEALGGRWCMDSALSDNLANMYVYDADSDKEKIAGMVSFVFCAVDMPKDVIEFQRKRLGTKRGFIAVKSNCSLQSYVPAMHPLMQKYEIDSALACTYQAISGAGKTFERWPEMVDNVIPFIGGEEEKSEQEPLKIWGKVTENGIENAVSPVITAQCLRVAASNGHMAAVFIKFKDIKPTKEEILNIWKEYSGVPQKLNLPSAPKQFLHYFEEDNRPQVQLDVNYENGMGISIGRLREDSLYDYKFIGLSHNTVRGAAGGAVLCAETLTAKGFITKK